MQQDPRMLWENLTPSELDAAIAHRPLAYVPCGALEWHGNHIATGCDLFRASEICSRGAALTGGVVLPPLYTTAPGFCAYRGSICFSPRLVASLISELLRELDKVGFQAVVLLLGHAGTPQMIAIGDAADTYEEKHDLHTLTIAGAALMPDEEPIPGGHAGPAETAECMAARPGSVYLDRFDAEDTKIPRYEGLIPATYTEGLPEGMHENVRVHMERRVWQWHPHVARLPSEEIGNKLLNMMAESLAEQALTLLTGEEEE